MKINKNKKWNIYVFKAKHKNLFSRKILSNEKNIIIETNNPVNKIFSIFISSINRGYKPNEIMILFRRRSVIMNNLIQKIKSSRFPIYQNNTSQIFIKSTIDLINYFLQNDKEKIFDHSTIQTLQHAKNKNISYQNIMRYLSIKIPTLITPTIIHSVIKSSNHLSKININSFFGFRKIFQTDIIEIKKNPEKNGVKIITIHASKGLESKIVIFYNDIEVKENTDEARLIYVAMTRAKQKLFVILDKNKKQNFT
jgi:ATP-dependent exoDNAse (exonuclease V) beta subunit